MTDDNWKLNAACNVTTPESDFWFPPVVLPGVRKETPAEKRERVALAVETCGHCPVRLRCAEASVNEVHGIWAGVDKGAVKTARRERPMTDREVDALRRGKETRAAAHTAAFDEFVETITTLHRAGATLREVLEHTGYDDRQVFYNRLHRRGRLDLYSMLTGAAA